MDLIGLFCKGEGKLFSGNRCEYYFSTVNCSYLISGCDERRFGGNSCDKVLIYECNMLIKKKMQEIFEKGRCQPSVMVKDAVEKNLRDYKDKIDSPEAYIESMSFEISERIKERCLDCPQLPVLKSYINRAAYIAVIGMLIKEQILLRGVCGNCGYLSNSRPYICERGYIEVEGERIENFYYGKERTLSSRSCEQGFEPFEPEPIDSFDDITIIEDDSDTDEASSAIEEMKESLAKRIETTTCKNTKRKHTRQHLVFCRFATLLQEGHSQTEALKEIAKKLGVTLKTIRRDFTDIREFFLKR